MRDSNGRFVKGHKVLKSWKAISSKSNKGKPSKSKTKFKKGMTPWNKGKKGVMPEPWNKGLKGFGAGNKNGMWKGDEVSLSGLHKWVYSRLGQPDTCEHCKKSGLKGHQIHWANKSGKYKRKKNDWVRLCVKCHWEFDEISKKTWEARDKNETRKWS